MPEIIDVAIPVDAEAAFALADARTHEAVGRIISRLLRPRPGQDPLLDVMRRLSADATAKGLIPETLERERADHKAERSC
jgi:hypothetical protein